MKMHKPWYSRRSRRLKAGLWCTSVLLVLMCGALAWVASKYSLRPTTVSGNYLLMGETQAKECSEGGGCEIFSDREFRAAVAQIIGGLQKQGLKEVEARQLQAGEPRSGGATSTPGMPALGATY